LYFFLVLNALHFVQFPSKNAPFLQLNEFGLHILLDQCDPDGHQHFLAESKALGMLLGLILLTLLVYGIFYCCQKYCGCCKQKKEKKPLIVHEETHVYSKPPPVVHHQQQVRHEHVVEHKPSHHSHARVEYGQPRITYGQSTVNEYREHAPSHMERRHVETRQLSPDRQNVVLHNEPVDWAKESRVRYAAPNQVSHVSGGEVRHVSNHDHQPQYSHMNPFHG